MSVESDNESTIKPADLASLESRLHGHANDEQMLVEVGAAMRAMLSGSGESEDQIRSLLQKQFDDGRLRKETYELVQNLLGQIVTEELARAPISPDAAMGEELFAQTAVIEDQAKAQIEAKTPAAPPEPLRPPVEPVQEVGVGSILRDRFLLKEKVAEGSMGDVYKALDKRLAEAGDDSVNVAIKVLTAKLSRNSAALRALQQEAAKGRCLTHPNIVRFIDLDREGDLYFIVMEWLEGRSLSRILDDDRGNVLDLQTAMDIVRQTGRALDYAHQRGVVHADVKPGNIIITPTGEVKLIDFGVARIRQKENEGKSRFDPGVTRAGSPAYSSMQVLTGEDPVPADDVFSLACLMYRLIAGYRVYGPRNAAQAAEDGMEPQRPQGLADEHWQPLKKALSYSRVTRFESAAAFVKALGIKPVKDSAFGHAPVKKPAPVEVTSPPETSDDRMDQLAEPPLKTAREPVPAARPKPQVTAPIRAEKEPIMYEPDDDDEESGRSPWRMAVVGIVLIAATVALVTQTDFVDRIGDVVSNVETGSLTDVFSGEPEIVDVAAPADSSQDIAEFVATDAPVGTDVDASESNSDAGETASDTIDLEPPVLSENGAAGDDEVMVPDDLFEEDMPEVAQIDYSSLPPATLTVNLATESVPAPVAALVIREGGDPAIVDIFRDDAATDQSMRISEASYSGNQSPRAAGQYSLENDGRIEFSAGQNRARITIPVRSNPVREPDRDVVLVIRNDADLTTTLATINMTLEDDDQRAFERGLPRNTVAFAVNQISVRESDPAAQIDVIRYNPDNSPLEVSYVLLDVTATEGQDYFMPGSTTVYFSAGQRTARILVPLGQDARAESDEAFMLELDSTNVPADSNIFSQIAVMIRDDDS